MGDDANFSFTEKLRHYMELRGMTVERLHELTGISKSHISDLRNGKIQSEMPGTEVRNLLEDALEIQRGQLIPSSYVIDELSEDESTFIFLDIAEMLVQHGVNIDGIKIESHEADLLINFARLLVLQRDKERAGDVMKENLKPSRKEEEAYKSI